MPQTTIIMQEAGPWGDVYVRNESLSDVNHNNERLFVGLIGTIISRTALGMNIAALFPSDTIFDAADLLLTERLSLSTGGTLEFQKIPSPFFNDDEATWNRLDLGSLWILPGIDVVSTPPMITAPFTFDQGVLTATGFQAFFQDAFDDEGGILGIRIRSADEVADRNTQFRSSSWTTESERPTWIITHHVLLGYRLFLKPGSSPNPAVDQPVVTVGSSAVSAVLDMAALGLDPNSGYHGLVTPFNPVGIAPTSAPFGFWTDGAGLPLLIPVPVLRLTAKPLAGGNVRVSWVYDEPNPLAMADTFEIEVFNDTSSFPFSVPHVAPGRKYTRDLTIGSDGLFQVRVKSDKGGLTQANVSPVAVMLDATPPAVVPVTLSAAE